MDEQTIAEMLRELPHPPESWVRAAQELPAARAAVDDLVSRAQADLALRDELLADIEAALRREGLEPTPRNAAALRAGLAA